MTQFLGDTALANTFKNLISGTFYPPWSKLFFGIQLSDNVTNYYLVLQHQNQMKLIATLNIF